MVNNNNFYVMLEKEWFYSLEEQTLLQKYGTVSLMVYSIMLRNLTMRNTFNFSVNGICSLLKVDVKNNSTMVKSIKDAIRTLNNNLFTVCLDSNCNEVADLINIDNKYTYFCIRKNEPLKDKFIMVYDTEINKLIAYSKGRKNSLDQLISHYIFICNGFNNTEKDEGYKCYYGGMDYIETKTGILNSTLLNNNKIFTELNLLFIGNAGGSLEDNMYKNTSNVYARVENKVEFDNFMEIKKASLNSKFASKTEKEQQDKQRQLKQLINKYKKDNELEGLNRNDLSDKEFNELYELEINYFNFVISRGKKLNNSKFLTIKKDGTIKEKYIPDEEFEEEIPCVEVVKPRGVLLNKKSKSVDDPILTKEEEREIVDYFYSPKELEELAKEREWENYGYNNYENDDNWGEASNF